MACFSVVVVAWLACGALEGVRGGLLLDQLYPRSQGDFQVLNPCTYPVPSRQSARDGCHRETLNLRRYNICDPQSQTSFTGLERLVAKLDEVYIGKSDYCICETQKRTSHVCWYRIGLAFINKLPLPKRDIPSEKGEEICSSNSTKTLPYLLKDDRNAILKAGQDFANILRERWKMGDCDEDILFFIVLDRPEELTPPTAKNIAIVFQSLGKKVRDRTSHMLTGNEQTKDAILSRTNKNFERGYPRITVLERMLEEYIDMLNTAERTYYQPRNRAHIPQWALAAFGGCILLLILMAIGVFLLKTGGRRNAMRSKSGQDANRRWKAGFVGGMFLRRKNGGNADDDQMD